MLDDQLDHDEAPILLINNIFRNIHKTRKPAATQQG